jgi:transposase
LSRSNDPVPVETRLQLVLAVLAHEMTVAEAARRHGVSAESINWWRNRFVDAGKAAMEDGMPGKAGSRGSLVERRQRAEIQELKLALAEAVRPHCAAVGGLVIGVPSLGLEAIVGRAPLTSPSTRIPLPWCIPGVPSRRTSTSSRPRLASSSP